MKSCLIVYPNAWTWSALQKLWYPGQFLPKKMDQNCQKTGHIYIKMDQNCIFKHTIIAWSIFLFAYLISQLRLKVIVSCTWVFHLFSHQIWPKTGQNWVKMGKIHMSNYYIMQCFFSRNFGTISLLDSPSITNTSAPAKCPALRGYCGGPTLKSWCDTLQSMKMCWK